MEWRSKSGETKGYGEPIAIRPGSGGRGGGGGRRTSGRGEADKSRAGWTTKPFICLRFICIRAKGTRTRRVCLRVVAERVTREPTTTGPINAKIPLFVPPHFTLDNRVLYTTRVVLSNRFYFDFDFRNIHRNIQPSFPSKKMRTIKKRRGGRKEKRFLKEVNVSRIFPRARYSPVVYFNTIILSPTHCRPSS